MVVTHAYTYTVHGALRLVQGSVTSSSFSAGRLEVFLYGEWGTICASGFGLIETLIACKQLGYNGVLDYGTSLGCVNSKL